MQYKQIRQGSIPVIKAEEKCAPPEWALLQNLLVDTMNKGAVEFVNRYTRPDGTLIWKEEWPGMDGSDDAYESFHNFALFYALGGSEELHSIARRQWDAVTWQWTEYGQIYREFDAYYDWMHHGESSIYFYYYGLADPTVLKDRQRTIRFANLYTGDDPEVHNYDSEKKLIRSPITGSRGPRFKMTAEDWETHREVLDHYLPPYEDIEGVNGPKCQWTDDVIFERVLEKLNQRMAKGDVPLNLNATSLVTHAYMYTGDEKYKKWVIDYLEAWAERTRQNEGIIPDNVGLSGKIGEYMDGKWWGGYYGWRWPHGALTIVEPLVTAGSNATLLTGDTSYLDLARSQIDMLWDRGKELDGDWVTPNRHFDNGWGDYRPANSSNPIHCWNISMEDQDLERILRVRNRDRWNTVSSRVRKGNRGSIEPWFNYTQGKNPDYPMQILKANYKAVCEHMGRIRQDNSCPKEYDIHYWQDVNPVITEALTQLTLGAPQNIYHGGLMHTPIRHFDGHAKRPGLPAGVAALVESINKNSLILNLVNTDLMNEKEVIVQSGSFGQHNFTQVDVLDEDGQIKSSQQVDGRWTAINLAPSAGIKLCLHTQRYANTPYYETPWITKEDYPKGLKGRVVE
jgi:hypothetical protein